jgi:hypothetical protein
MTLRTRWVTLRARWVTLTENMSNAELTLWMRTLFPELPAPQGGNGQEARGFNWWKDVLQEDCFDGLAKYFGLDEPTMRLLVEKYQVRRLQEEQHRLGHGGDRNGPQTINESKISR